MNLCKKWELNPWICWWCELKQTTGLKFSSESVTKDVNLSYPIVWAWESNPGPSQVWNRKPIQGVQRGLEPMTMLQGWLKQYKCSNLEIEPLTLVLWDKILVKKLFFIPWWWVLSTMGLLLLLIMKLFIVYLGTIRLVEVHCTGVWEVYSCTIYQRLAFENMFGGEVYFTRPRKKRNSKSSILYY